MTAELQEAIAITDRVLAHHEKLQLVRGVSGGNFREKIVEFEKWLVGIEGAFFGDTDNCPLKHSFANGIYMRQIFIPATTLYVSRIHKFDHHRIILAGELTAVDEFHGLQRLHAPMSMICHAGTKRVGYAHTDCVIATLHQSEEGDPDVIMRRLYCDTYEELDSFIAQQKALTP